MLQRTSSTIDLDGDVHFVDYGGEGDPIVLVHGLGGSHVNWWALGPLLAERYRVLALDLPGFGRTMPAGRRSTVSANTDLLRRFIVKVAGAPVVLVGNSMGGMIALHVAARAPDLVDGLVLLDSSLPGAPGGMVDVEILRNFAAFMVPGMGERLLRRRRERLGPEGLVRESLRLCCAHPGAVPTDLLEATLDFATERWDAQHAERAFLEAARSLITVLGNRTAYRRIIEAVSAPTLLLHGAHDRLVPLAAAAQAARKRPDWTFQVLDDVGHVPQIEAPGETAHHILRWLDT